MPWFVVCFTFRLRSRSHGVRYVRQRSASAQLLHYQHLPRTHRANDQIVDLRDSPPNSSKTPVQSNKRTHLLRRTRRHSIQHPGTNSLPTTVTTNLAPRKTVPVAEVQWRPIWTLCLAKISLLSPYLCTYISSPPCPLCSQRPCSPTKVFYKINPFQLYWLPQLSSRNTQTCV